MPPIKQIAESIIFAYSTVDIEIFIYVQFFVASITTPTQPTVEIVIVYPVGTDSEGFSSVQFDLAVIVLLIFKYQDLICLS